MVSSGTKECLQVPNIMAVDVHTILGSAFYLKIQWQHYSLYIL